MATQLFDLNTGKVVNPYNTATDFVQTTGTGPKTGAAKTTTTERSTQEQRGSSVSSSINTTPAILQALENFITQMSDRPAISNAELDKVAPIPRGQYINGQWITIDPLTGMQVYQENVARLTAQRQAQREQLTKEAGVIPGGTADQRKIADARTEEISRNRELQGDYSKEAAIADAKELTNYFARLLSEQQMPAILRAEEAAGASASTVRGLLTQQAIQRTSESAAQVGAELATKYGQISANLANTLEALTRQDPNGVAAQLLQALNVGKGIAGQTAQSTNTTVNTTTTKSSDQATAESGQLQVVFKQFLDEIAGSNAPVAAPKDEYTPSSQAGTGYVVANPTYGGEDQFIRS